MKPSQHTPTPWDYSGEFIVTPDRGTIIAEMKSFKGEVISHDSEFIVRAVNSHEALLKAAKHFRDCGFPEMQTSQEERCVECEEGEKAIAQAEVLP